MGTEPAEVVPTINVPIEGDDALINRFAGQLEKQDVAGGQLLSPRELNSSTTA